MNNNNGTFEVLVRQIRFEGKGINSYELVDPKGGELPSFTPGAHIDVHLKGGLTRQYSLCNDAGERRRYVIAVLKEADGRGGSRSVHEQLHVQDTVAISYPRNNFALAEQPGRVILIAGGIGITPLKSMAHQLESAGRDFEMHYCAKDRDYAAFATELDALERRGRVVYHFDQGDPSRGLNIGELLKDHDGITHVYYCGPAGFMTACAAASAHWPSTHVHLEHFKPPESGGQSVTAAGDGYQVEIASSGRRISATAEESLAELLNRSGVPVETSCQSGLCGTCKTRYLSGEVVHNDFILDDDEHRQFLTPCVSRGSCGVLVLDL